MDPSKTHKLLFQRLELDSDFLPWSVTLRGWIDINPGYKFLVDDTVAALPGVPPVKADPSLNITGHAGLSADQATTRAEASFRALVMPTLHPSVLNAVFASESRSGKTLTGFRLYSFLRKHVLGVSYLDHARLEEQIRTQSLSSFSGTQAKIVRKYFNVDAAYNLCFQKTN